MPITTYLEPAVQESIASGELTVLLEELKRSAGRSWLIREEAIEVRKLVFKKETDYKYQLLIHLHGGEYQIINLYNEEKVSSLNLWYGESVVVAYITGYLAGLAKQVQNAQ